MDFSRNLAAQTAEARRMGVDSIQGRGMTDSQALRSAYFLRTAKKIAEEVLFSHQRKDFDRVVRKTRQDP